MYAVVGPVRTRANGYAFDVWLPQAGLRSGFSYPRVQDACYARKAEISEWRDGGSIPAIVCETVDEFVSEIAALAVNGPRALECAPEAGQFQAAGLTRVRAC